MKLIETKTYLVGFKEKGSNAMTIQRAIEGNLTEVVEIATEYANKYNYVIAVIKENDINTIRRSTKTISIDV